MNALITELVLLQLALPLALVLLHAVLVPASVAGLVMRSIGIALLLLYLALAGVWLFPPWWTPWALLVLHLIATALAYRRYASRSRSPARTRRGVELGVGALMAALAVLLLQPALTGRVAPPGTVALATPLEAGTYLVTSGGASESINSHLALGNRLKALPDARRHATWRGQSHAVDLIAIDRLGLRASGLSPVEPARYRMYGRRVLAPCDGTVEAAGDGVPDMPVPEMDREHMLGNHVILRCDGVHVVLAHLAPGTLRVSPGDGVITGEELGRAGNTGNTAEPHLHVHVQRDLPAEAPIGGEPLWFTIDGRFLVRGDRLVIS